jgi:hypothetical protein
MMLPYSPTLQLIESYVGIYRIYTLKNPTTNEIFYVGQTMQGLNTRLSGHISETGASNREKILYIKSIVEAGNKPIIEAIEVISTKCYIDKIMVNERELYWIKFYKDKGCNLLNKAGIYSQGSSSEYRGYLASLKRGETHYHYYVCGKTYGGHEVYDEQRLRADGFVLKMPIHQPPKEEVRRQLINQPENKYLGERLAKKIGVFTPKQPKRYTVIKTEIFPEEPQWSREFSKEIPYDPNDPFDCEFEYDFDENMELEPDLEPDVDDEPDYDEEPEHDGEDETEEIC